VWFAVKFVVPSGGQLITKSVLSEALQDQCIPGMAMSVVQKLFFEMGARRTRSEGGAGA